MPATPEQNIEIHRGQIKCFIDAAANWREQNNSGWELFCLYNATKNSLTVAVKQYATPEAAAEFLSKEFRPTVFDRTCELIRELHIDGAGPPINTPPAGHFDLVLVVHAGWLLGLHSEAQEIAKVCDDSKQHRHFQSDVFWRNYCSGIAAVADGHSFVPMDRKHTGYQRHWATYLPLMADIVAGKDLSSALAAIDDSFAQRNRDKRLISYGPDGDGTLPVKWDFRKHSLLLAAQYYAGRSAQRHPVPENK